MNQAEYKTLTKISQGAELLKEKEKGCNWLRLKIIFEIN